MKNDLLEQFNSCIENVDSCSIWLGCLRKDGYPRFSVDGKWYQVAKIVCLLDRYSLEEIFVNNTYSQSKGRMYNMCGNKLCINRNHLSFNRKRKLRLKSVTLTARQQV